MKRCIAFLCTLLLLFSVVPSVAAAEQADLTVTAVEWTGGDGQVTPNTTLTFKVTVQNLRSVTVAGYTVDLYFGTKRLETKQAGTLRGGESATVTFTPWKATAGDAMVTAIVNADKAVAETNTKNNSMQRNLRVASDRLGSAYAYTDEIIKKAGMTDLIFNDDFNDPNSVDNQKTKAAGYKWYLTRPYGAPDLDGGDYSVKNGVMTVKNVTPTYNYGLGTVDTDSHVGFTFNTGYLEVKLRMPRPRANTATEKGVPAIWALPPEKLYGNDTHWVELDWLEYWGDDYYTICLHEQVRPIGGATTQWNKNSNASFHGLGDGEWHVMGWLWQEGLFITYLDGKEVMRLEWSEGDFAWPTQTTVEGEMQLGAFVHLDEQCMPITIGGSADNPMELDWVRVFDGKTNGTYVPGEEEDEPTMSSAEFVYNFALDYYGDPIKTVTKDNVDVILSGETVWNGLPDAVKKQVNEYLKNNGQADFDTLLSQAKKAQSTPADTTTKPQAATTQKTQAATTQKPQTTVKKPVATTVLGSTPTTENTTAVETTTTYPVTKQEGTQIYVTTTTTAAKQEQPPKGNAVGIIIAVAAVLVLGGATAAVLVWYKKKK